METRYQCYISKTEVGGDFESLISSHLHCKMYCIITLLSQMLDFIKVYPKYIYTKKNYGLTICAICFVLGYRKVRGKIGCRKLTSNYVLPLALIDFSSSWTQHIK